MDFNGTEYFAEFRSYLVNSVFKFEFVQLIHLMNFARAPKFSKKFVSVTFRVQIITSYFTNCRVNSDYYHQTISNVTKMQSSLFPMN